MGTIFVAIIVWNIFIAGVTWEDNFTEPLRQRIAYTIIALVAGTFIHLLYGLYKWSKPLRQKIERKTDLWFWVSWQFVKKDWLDFPEEVFEKMREDYTELLKLKGFTFWQRRKGIEMIFKFTKRQLP